MLITHDYGSACWWCGAIATTGEHKYKKTDIKREFFDPSQPLAPVIIRDGQQILVQGPNSDSLKFPLVLCAPCNTAKSQPLDRAYDLVIEYLAANEISLAQGAYIDFSKIDPISTVTTKLDFLRYVVKHICCRLSQNKVQIASSVIEFLNGETNILDGMAIHFIQNLDLLALIHAPKDPLGTYLGLSPLHVNFDRHRIQNAYGALHYRSFEIRYICDNMIDQAHFPGLHEYNAYPIAVLTKVALRGVIPDSLNYLNIPAAHDASPDEYSRLAYNALMYRWYLNPS